MGIFHEDYWRQMALILFKLVPIGKIFYVLHMNIALIFYLVLWKRKGFMLNCRHGEFL